MKMNALLISCMMVKKITMKTMRYYEFKVLGKDEYMVIKVDDKYPKGDIRRYKEYFIDLRNGDMLCSCPAFMFTKKACKHVKFILSQLKDGGGILDFQNTPHKCVVEK